MELVHFNEGYSISPVDVSSAQRKSPSNWLLVPLIFLLSEVKQPPRTTPVNGKASLPPYMEGDGILQLFLKAERAPKSPETGLPGTKRSREDGCREHGHLHCCDRSSMRRQKPPSILYKPVNIKHGQRKEKSYDSWRSTVSYDCYLLFNLSVLAKIPPIGGNRVRLLILVSVFI